MPPALEVDSLRKRYGARTAVDGLSLTAATGAITAVLGPNGAGKTTTIECCEGLRRPDAGSIRVLGLDRAAASSAPLLRERVGVMLQDGGLPLAPRAGAVLDHLARLHADPEPPARLLERLGLTDVAGTRVRRLSGGQRQRLALAGALVGRPELAFLDEPSAGLDPQSRHAVWDLLRELRAGGTSVILNTHLMDEAEALADHVVVIDHGRVVAEGTPAALTGGARIRVVLRAGAVSPGTAAAGGHPAGPGDALVAALDAALAGRGDLRVLDGDVADARGRGPAHASDRVLHIGGPQDPDAGAVVAVATALAQIGHPDATVDLHRPSLEDAFLALTGRELRQEAS
ncbi:ABC transporter ATP-binding protein [Georgenia faecalis]|uniref:ABC transporter ATP-binding protein n=1 Tax=Georgenia faecalis TaxID=2483799 RepID=UPI000FD9F8BF|nr:ABC transporter ATP-binding protein [Georgenia faecalis]